MNLCNLQPGWRHDGESRSMVRGRVAAQVVRTRDGIESPLLDSTNVAGNKPTGFGGAARGSPG